mmetsp:Transcript_8127/g.12452  ORF Transcript_8127/g.12452 Transcript_8127/m.12452 type:complete len:90 (-) Transcript_8127:190-459(-)
MSSMSDSSQQSSMQVTGCETSMLNPCSILSPIIQLWNSPRPPAFPEEHQNQVSKLFLQALHTGLFLPVCSKKRNLLEWTWKAIYCEVVH